MGLQLYRSPQLQILPPVSGLAHHSHANHSRPRIHARPLQQGEPQSYTSHRLLRSDRHNQRAHISDRRPHRLPPGPGEPRSYHQRTGDWQVPHGRQSFRRRLRQQLAKSHVHATASQLHTL